MTVEQVKLEEVRYGLEKDAVILLAARRAFGFGPDRLKKLFDAVVTLSREMDERYENHAVNGEIAMNELLRIGVDVKAWNLELFPDLERFIRDEEPGEKTCGGCLHFCVCQTHVENLKENSKAEKCPFFTGKGEKKA